MCRAKYTVEKKCVGQQFPRGDYLTLNLAYKLYVVLDGHKDSITPNIV